MSFRIVRAAKRMVVIAFFLVNWVTPAQASGPEEKQESPDKKDDSSPYDKIMKDLSDAGKELVSAIAKDIKSINLKRRWAVIKIIVVDATGSGVDPYAISGPLHAAMVVNSTYGWEGTRWKFAVLKPDVDSGGSLHVLGLVHNVAPSAAEKLKTEIGDLVTPETVAVQLYVVVLPNGDLEYIMVGFYQKRSGKTVPVFRAFTGGIERGANEILRLCLAAQR